MGVPRQQSDFHKKLSNYTRMKYINFFLFFVIICSCSVKEKEIVNEGLQTIFLKESNDILPISSFVKELNYIELQFADNKIDLGEILDVKILDNDLILTQRRANEISILRFTKDGRFLNELVSNKGGKGAISYPLDIITYKKDYAVLAKNGIYIIGKDGKFKTRLYSSEMPGSKLFESKGSFYVVNEIPDGGLFSEFSGQKNIARKKAFPEARIREMGMSNIETQLHKSAHFYSSYSDTVFSYSGKSFEPEYRIESENYPSFAELWRTVGDRTDMETLKYINNTQHAKIKRYFENDYYIFITYWLGSHSTTAIIKKENWEVTYFSQAVNNLDGGIWDKPFYLSVDSELFIPISAYKVSGHKISDKRHHEFEEVQSRISASGNPVIMCCHLR